MTWGYFWRVNGGPNQWVPASVPSGLTNVVMVTGGAGHGLALRDDGTVRAWGDNSYGQARVPAGLGHVVSITAGFWHNLALKDDGTVVAWGAGDRPDPDDPNGFSAGQSMVPPGLTNAVSIAAGYLHSYALRADGTVVAWGSDGVGQCTVPRGLQQVVQLDSGQNRGLALKADGTLVTWGHYFDRPATVPAGLGDVVDIAAGDFHTIVQQSDGTLVSWGHGNQSGELDVPPGLVAPSSLAAGGVHTLALTRERDVVAWGAGKVVDRTTGADWGQSLVPAAVTQAAVIGAGYVQSLAILGESAPWIPANLPDRGILHGQTARLHVHAIGSGPLRHQWLREGNALAEATNALWQIPDLQFADAGLYSVRIENPVGQVVSRAFRLDVLPLLITRQPEDVVVARGESATFSVQCDGPGPFSYQWQWGSVDLVGATNADLVLESAQPQQAGLYSVVVRNPLGPVRSQAARLSFTDVVAWGVNHLDALAVPSGADQVIAVAAGSSHSLALRRDGTVLAWGNTNNGLASIPASVSNVAAIACGNHHNLVLRNDGTVIAWGFGTNVPPGLTNVTAIAAGHLHNLALKADGTVTAWGWSSWNWTNVAANTPPGLQSVVAIAGGYDFSLAVRADGSVAGWGNVPGLPEQMPASNVVAVAAGHAHYVALYADGTVSVHGADPTFARGLSHVVAVAAGSDYSLALRADGTVAGWPTRQGGGPSMASVVPAGLSNVVALAAGWQHGLAVLGSGPPQLVQGNLPRTVAQGTPTHLRVVVAGEWPLEYQWRANGRDIVGATNAVLSVTDTTPEDSGAYTVVVRNAQGALEFGAGSVRLAPFFITTQPQSRSVVRGDSLQLTVEARGAGPFSYQWTKDGRVREPGPDPVLRLDDLAIADSGSYCVTIRNAYGVLVSESAWVSVGRVFPWGSGIGGLTNLAYGLSNVAAVAVGNHHALALRGDGTVAAWGWSSNAGIYEDQTNVPPDLNQVVAIACGSHHSLALRWDGTVVAWGHPENPALRAPPSLSNVVALAGGGTHSLALRADGTVAAWGGNEYGQSRVPTGLSNVIAIAAGLSDSFALRADGTVRVWGDNSHPSSQPPSGLSNVVAITAGWQHAVALKQDGTVVAWGNVIPGQTNGPPGLTGVVSVKAGGHRTVAELADGRLVSWGVASGVPAYPATPFPMRQMAVGPSQDLLIVEQVSPVAFPIAALGSDTLTFRQTGLFRQVIHVHNASATVFPAVRLTVHGLPPGGTLWNAHGTDAEGHSFVVNNTPLAPGQSIDLTLEILQADRTQPQFSVTTEVIEPIPPVAVPNGVVHHVDRSVHLPDGTYLIDFAADRGRIYYVQYSDDLATWKTALPALAGRGGTLQWTDCGPPKTEGSPAVVSHRFYRVLWAP